MSTTTIDNQPALTGGSRVVKGTAGRGYSCNIFRLAAIRKLAS